MAIAIPAVGAAGEWVIEKTAQAVVSYLVSKGLDKLKELLASKLNGAAVLGALPSHLEALGALERGAVARELGLPLGPTVWVSALALADARVLAEIGDGGWRKGLARVVSLKPIISIDSLSKGGVVP